MILKRKTLEFLASLDKLESNIKYDYKLFLYDPLSGRVWKARQGQGSYEENESWPWRFFVHRSSFKCGNIYKRMSDVGEWYFAYISHNEKVSLEANSALKCPWQLALRLGIPVNRYYTIYRARKAKESVLISTDNQIKPSKVKVDKWIACSCVNKHYSKAGALRCMLKLERKGFETKLIMVDL